MNREQLADDELSVLLSRLHTIDKSDAIDLQALEHLFAYFWVTHVISHGNAARRLKWIFDDGLVPQTMLRCFPHLLGLVLKQKVQLIGRFVIVVP